MAEGIIYSLLLIILIAAYIAADRNLPTMVRHQEVLFAPFERFRGSRKGLPRLGESVARALVWLLAAALCFAIVVAVGYAVLSNLGLAIAVAAGDFMGLFVFFSVAR